MQPAKLVFAVLLVFGVLPTPAKSDEAEILKHLQQAGGTNGPPAAISRDATRPGHPIVGLDLFGTDFGDAGLK